MNATRLAALRRSLTMAASRRAVLESLAAGVLVAGPFARLADDAAARKKSKGKKNRKNKKRKNSKAKTRTDARCSGPSDGSSVRPPAPGPRIAQTFAALRSGELVSAEIEAESPGASGDFILRLAPLDSAGLPTNIVLAESLVARAEVPAGPATVRFTFPNPASVVAGTEYALVLTRFAGDGFAWNGRNLDPCAGRSFGSADQSAPFQENEGLDLIFTTFVRS